MGEDGRAPGRHKSPRNSPKLIHPIPLGNREPSADALALKHGKPALTALGKRILVIDLGERAERQAILTRHRAAWAATGA
jgi:hypothetical protein